MPYQLTVQRNPTITINVRDYQAQGDGVSNDTTPINAAFTALSAAITQYGNASLIVPQGIYMVDGILVQNLSNFSILGPGHLKLNRARSGNALVNTNDVLTLVNCTDFTVDGLEVDGNRHTDVSWPTGDHAPVTQYLQSNAASGQANVAVSNGALFQVGERVWVCGGLTANGATENNNVDNNSQRGIAISSISSNTLTLASNLANSYTSTCAAGGAYVTTYQTGYQNTVGSYTLGNEDQQNGLHLINCTRFTITKCYCHDIWESGIKCGVGFDTNANNLASACTHGLIMQNRCIRGYDQGVSIWNSQFIRVVGNYCADAGWGGCVLTHSDDCIVTENTLYDNYYRIPGDNSEGSGAVIEGGARNLIAKNLISANYLAGVLLRHSPEGFGVSGVTLNGNLSWGSTSVPVSSGTNFVIGATYSINDGAKSEVVKVTAVSTNTLTIAEKTRFYHGSGTAIGTRVSEDNTIEANEITESISQHGIWCSPTVRALIRHNTISRNYQKGIYAQTSSGFNTAAIIIDGNYLSGNGQGSSSQGILCDTVTDIQVLNNRISGNFGDRGMQFKGISNSKVIGNSVTDGQSDGIEFENGAAACTRIVVANNDVK